MTQTNLAHRINAIQNTAEVIAESLKEMIPKIKEKGIELVPLSMVME